MNARLLPVFAAAVLLAACAITPPESARMTPEVRRAWQAQQARMAEVDAWDIKGRMAVRTADDGGSATFIWERDGDTHQIEMYGPFGGGRVSISQDPDGAVLRDSKDAYLEAADAQTLLFRRVGWHVPFESLKHWLKGVPAPSSRVEGLTVDAAGRALGFRQDGWDIAILDYETSPGFDVPRRVFIEALPGTVHLVNDDGEDLGDRLEVKVVLRRWLPLQSGL